MRPKSYLPNIFVAIIVAGLAFVIQTNATYAQAPIVAAASAAKEMFFGSSNLLGLVNDILSYIVNTALMLTGFLVSMAAYILDVSIKLTLHIKDFVDATPAIYTVWQTLRDITGLFFIFYLLYAAIQMITGYGKGPSYAETIKNIVVAGILINFSFFLTSIAIDASNIISQAIYNSMIPNHAEVHISPTSSLSDLVGQSGSSDISNVFMNSLKIQTIYDVQGNKLGASGSDPFKIIMIGITGIIMMLTTAASFILAAIAFISRLIILLFLLAFSPLWFAGKMLPDLEKYMGKFYDALYSQLVFMPVYLLLMYVALRILNESNIMGAMMSANSNLPTGTNWAFPFIILAVNFVLVIFMLNLPLFVGLSMGSMATTLISGGMKKFDAGNIWKGVGSQAGSRTLGRAAYALNESSAIKGLASRSPLLGGLASKGLSGVSSAGFGAKKGGSYEDRLKAKKTNYEKLHKHIGNVDRDNYSSEAEYIEAKRKAEEMKKEYRENIPWGNNSVIGFMLDNRANKQVSRSLTEEAMLKENKAKIVENDTRIKEIEKLVNTEPGSLRLLTSEEIAEKKRLERENVELQGAVDRASGSKKKKDTSAALKQLADQAKEEAGGEEKPKEDKGGEDKPKEDKK
ncbi:MAG: hypothetical protein WCS89_02905 [Candidatus Paceibacterota bacterium]